MGTAIGIIAGILAFAGLIGLTFELYANHQNRKKGAKVENQGDPGNEDKVYIPPVPRIPDEMNDWRRKDKGYDPHLKGEPTELSIVDIYYWTDNFGKTQFSPILYDPRANDIFAMNWPLEVKAAENGLNALMAQWYSAK